MDDLQARLDRAIDNERAAIRRAIALHLTGYQDRITRFAALVALRTRMEEHIRECGTPQCLQKQELNAEAKRLLEREDA